MNTPIPKIDTTINFKIELVKETLSDILKDSSKNGFHLKDKNELFGTYSIGITKSSAVDFISTGSMTVTLQSEEDNKTRIIVETMSTSPSSSGSAIIGNAQTDFLKVLSTRLSGDTESENFNLKSNKGCLLFFIIIIGMFLIPALCFGQNENSFIFLPKEDGVITFTKIIELDSLSKDQIYTKIKNWATTFYSSANALQADDKSGGFLAYKAYDNYLKATSSTKFFIKDFKVKAQITNIETEITLVPMALEKYELDLFKQFEKRKEKGKSTNLIYLKAIDNIMNALLNSIEKDLRKKSAFDF